MTSRLKSALEGEDVNVIKLPDSSGEGEDGSGSGSGSGSSASGENEIPTYGPTEKTITNGNEIEEENMLGGGVSNTNDGNVLGNKRTNSGNRLSPSSAFTGLLMIVFIISRLC